MKVNKLRCNSQKREKLTESTDLDGELQLLLNGATHTRMGSFTSWLHSQLNIVMFLLRLSVKKLWKWCRMQSGGAECGLLIACGD